MNGDPVFCEKCGGAGLRPLTHTAPPHWLFLETVVEIAGARQRMITYACTPVCAEALWRVGPGPQLPEVGPKIAAAIGRRESTSMVTQLAEAIAAKLSQKPTPRPACLMQEGNCKAADCPQHGWAQGDG